MLVGQLGSFVGAFVAALLWNHRSVRLFGHALALIPATWILLHGLFPMAFGNPEESPMAVHLAALAGGWVWVYWSYARRDFPRPLIGGGWLLQAAAAVTMLSVGHPEFAVSIALLLCLGPSWRPFRPMCLRGAVGMFVLLLSWGAVYSIRYDDAITVSIFFAISSVIAVPLSLTVRLGVAEPPPPELESGHGGDGSEVRTLVVSESGEGVRALQA